MECVYVVILNYRQWQDTADCVRSLLASDYEFYRIIVVDNNSGNHSLEQVQSVISRTENITGLKIPGPDFQMHFPVLPKLTLVQHSENAGFAGGNNLVLKTLSEAGGYVWLLNPDMVVEPSTMRTLVEFATRQTGRNIIGSVIRSWKEPGKILLYGGARINFNTATIEPVTDPRDVDRVDFICGGSMFLPASYWKELGLLPEDYFLYWEETDWCYRAAEKGYRMLVCPDAACYDKMSTSIGKGFLADYYYTRNGIRFTARFKRRLLPVVIFSAVLRFMKRLLTGQWRRAVGVYRGMLHFPKHDQGSHE